MGKSPMKKKAKHRGSERDLFTSNCLSARGRGFEYAEGQQEEDGSEEGSPSSALSLQNHGYFLLVAVAVLPIQVDRRGLRWALQAGALLESPFSQSD